MENYDDWRLLMNAADSSHTITIPLMREEEQAERLDAVAVAEGISKEEAALRLFTLALDEVNPRGDQ